MDDNKIIDLYFSRDESAIEETKTKYGKLIFSVAFRILGNHQDTEECESDTYLKAWNTIPPTVPNSLPAYLSSIARNFAITRYRVNKRHREMDRILREISEVIPEFGSDVSDEVDLRDALGEFVDGLDTQKQLVFLKRYFYMMSVAEISADMKISLGTVKSSLSRMRIALKKYLEERGISI